MLCESSRAEELASELPRGGHTKLLRIDYEGAVVTDVADQADVTALT